MQSKLTNILEKPWWVLIYSCLLMSTLFGYQRYLDSKHSFTTLQILFNASIIVDFPNLQCSSHGLVATLYVNILIGTMHFWIGDKPKRLWEIKIMCNNIHDVTSCMLHLVSLPKVMIVITMVIGKVVMPYVIMAMLFLSLNVCTIADPTSFMIGSPFRLSAKQYVEDYLFNIKLLLAWNCGNLLIIAPSLQLVDTQCWQWIAYRQCAPNQFIDAQC